MKVTKNIVVWKIKDKGALFVEYALIFAFVIVAGIMFVGNRGFTDSINKIFYNVEKILAVASNKDNNLPAKSYDVRLNTYWSSADLPNKGVFTERTLENFDWAKYVNSSDLIEVGTGAQYSIILDKTAMVDYLSTNGNTDANEENVDKYLNDIKVGFFSMNENKAPVEAKFVSDNGTVLGKQSDSGSLSINQIKSGISLDASAEKDRVYVSYNIIHSQAANTSQYKDYDKALINAGIKITAGK